LTRADNRLTGNSLAAYLCGRLGGRRVSATGGYSITSILIRSFKTVSRELLLISGLQTYGLGNWAEVADYVGTRLKEDCERHYTETYLVERSSTKKDLHRYDSPHINGINPGGSPSSDIHMSFQQDSQDLFTDSNGETEHPGLCTSANVINDLGGVGGFGKITKSGERGRKRRQGWWGGLGVGDGWTCPMPVSRR
jgi:hypothetical protein